MPIMALLSLVSCEDKDDAITNDANSIVDASDDENEWQNCQQVNLSVGNTNGYEYVDLGLPSGNLWATMNIGADKIEAYGDLYSWGETSTKNNYGKVCYSFYKKDEPVVDDIHGYTKYIPKDKASEYGYGGFFDNKTTLDLTDDVAHVKLGGSWRMPTACDFDELLENCDKVWCTYQGVNGYKFTAKNGKWLFLPAAGCSYGSYDYYLNYEGVSGYYCSSSLNSHNPPYTSSLYFSSGCIYVDDLSRYYGCSVRAVCPSAR